MVDFQSKIPLSELAGRLAQVTVDGQTRTYPQLWRYVVDGKMPTTKIGRSYFVNEDDLPAIARIVGLTLRAPTPTRRANAASANAA